MSWGEGAEERACAPWVTASGGVWGQFATTVGQTRVQDEPGERTWEWATAFECMTTAGAGPLST